MHAFPEKYTKPSLLNLDGAEGLGWSAVCKGGGGPGTDPSCSAGPSTPHTICVFLTHNSGHSGNFLTPDRVGSGL